MKPKIIINYQTKNLRYAVEELAKDYEIYSWRSTALEFTKKTLPELHPNIKENIDVDSASRHEMAEIVKGWMDLRGIKYVFPLYNDMLLPHIHDILKISTDTGYIIGNKERYSDFAQGLGIPVPKKFDTYDLEYPAIGKPVNGTGGLGIKVLLNEEELNDFENGKDINYNTLGSYYMFQEFISGPIISVAGRIVDDEILFDCIYDIEISDLPYRAETGFTWPSKYTNEEIETQIKEDLSKFIHALPDLDNQPFMADFVLHEGTAYFIDFSARMSVSAQTIIKYSANCDYNLQVVKSQIEKDNTPVVCVKPVVYRYFNYPKGTYNFSCDDHSLAEEFELPSSVQFMKRLDMLVSFNGYAVTVGETYAEAEYKWKQVSESINASSL